MAAILCRMVQPESRLLFTPQPKPADLTVRNSKALVVNGRPFYGLVDVGGETYLPLALSDGSHTPMSRLIFYSDWDSKYDKYFIRAYPQIKDCDKITTKAGGRNGGKKRYKSWTISDAFWETAKEDITERS